jgi:hypothetical protein
MTRLAGVPAAGGRHLEPLPTDRPGVSAAAVPTHQGALHGGRRPCRVGAAPDRYHDQGDFSASGGRACSAPMLGRTCVRWGKRRVDPLRALIGQRYETRAALARGAARITAPRRWTTSMTPSGAWPIGAMRAFSRPSTGSWRIGSSCRSGRRRSPCPRPSRRS